MILAGAHVAWSSWPNSQRFGRKRLKRPTGNSRHNQFVRGVGRPKELVDPPIVFERRRSRQAAPVPAARFEPFRSHRADERDNGAVSGNAMQFAQEEWSVH